MNGWNMIYALINFAILAAGLYFVGKKIVAKMFADHRKAVEEEIEHTARSVENAGSLLNSLEKRKSDGQLACEEILSQARSAAEENSRSSRRRDEEAAERLAAEREKKEQLLRADRRRAVAGAAAETITQTAASLLAQKPYADARSALLRQQIEDFVSGYRPTAGELESFAEKGKAQIHLRFAEEPAGDDAARIERVIADRISACMKKTVPTEAASRGDANSLSLNGEELRRSVCERIRVFPMETKTLIEIAAFVAEIKKALAEGK